MHRFSVPIAREIVRRGIATGELRPGLDPDVVLDALYGSIYHRLLVPYNNAPIFGSYIDAIIDIIKIIESAKTAD